MYILVNLKLDRLGYVKLRATGIDSDIFEKLHSRMSRTQWLKNLETSKRQRSSETIKKIAKKLKLNAFNYISRGKTPEDIFVECVANEDTWVLWGLVPEPRKQTWDERFQLAFINHFAKNTYFQKQNPALAFIRGELPKVSTWDELGAICPSNNATITFKSPAGEQKNAILTKTIDAVGEFRMNVWNQNKMYLYMKYTTGVGGGQDNQFDDVKQFVRVCNEYMLVGSNYDTRCQFVCVVDGDYYTDKKKVQLKTLVSQQNQTNLMILSSAELVLKLNDSM